MSKLDFVLEELVTATVSWPTKGSSILRAMSALAHPDNPDHYLLSRARAPERIERDDIVEYTLDGTAIDERGRAPYLERFIHGAVYETAPDVHSVVHNHSPSVIPFGVTAKNSSRFCTCALRSAMKCRYRIPRQVRRYHASGHRHGDGPRSRAAHGIAADRADARPRRDRGRPLGPPLGLCLSLIWRSAPSCKCKSMAMGEIKFLTAAKSTRSSRA